MGRAGTRTRCCATYSLTSPFLHSHGIGATVLHTSGFRHTSPLGSLARPSALRVSALVRINALRFSFATLREYSHTFRLFAPSPMLHFRASELAICVGLVTCQYTTAVVCDLCVWWGFLNPSIPVRVSCILHPVVQVCRAIMSKKLTPTAAAVLHIVPAPYCGLPVGGCHIMSSSLCCNLARSRLKTGTKVRPAARVREGKNFFN